MSATPDADDDSPTGIHLQASESLKGRKPGFLRGLSRKKSLKMSGESGGATAGAKTNPSKMSRGLSRKKHLCEKLARAKEEPIFGSRSKTGEMTLAAKKRVVEEYPGLAIQRASDRASELVLQGINSIRAETIDFYGMVVVMQDNVKMLTRAAVDRFFEWIPLFTLYLERYLMVEEDFMFKWIEKKTDLKGSLRPSGRMEMSGRMQKSIRDVQETEDLFVPALPPGERLPKLVEVARVFTELVATYCNLVVENLPRVIREHFDKSEVEKAKVKIIKHLVTHIGYQDFVALYTRWMRAGDLLEWKTSVLFPCDFKFFSYTTWDKDMDVAHYQIAAQFAEVLQEENKEAVELNKQSKADFDRALATRQHMEPFEEQEMDGCGMENGEELEYTDDEEK